MVKMEWSRGSGNKKYKVVLFEGGKKLKSVQFGSKSNNQFFDSTPLQLYTSKNHNDKKQRKAYFARHKINYPKYSADWYSKRYLWSKK